MRLCAVKMFLGTQYYRPPNPPSGDWNRDLKNIKELGMEIIRTWLYWSRVNPREGVWVWDEYDRLIELTERHGLKVFIQLMCDGTPYWFQDKYPQALYLDVKGFRVEFSAHAAQSIGGAPGPCFHTPEARMAAEEFMRKTAERYLNASALYGYDLWNEIWMRECFCEHTTRLFQKWLERKYVSVDVLNKVWQRSYASFAEVRLPKNGVYADMFDRYEFEQWSRAELMRWRAETVRSVDRIHPVFSHFGGSVSLVNPEVDPWLLSESIDKWGTSCYDADLVAAHLTMNATAWASKGRPWWLSEQTGGLTWSGIPARLRSDGFLRSFQILAMSLGAEASIYWQWRPETFGQESPNFGLTGLNGELTSRTETVKQVTSMIQRHGDVFDGMKLEDPRVGLVWDSHSIMFEQLSQGPRKPGAWVGWENFLGYYRALLDGGYAVEVLNAREVAEGGVPNNLRMVIAPHQFIDRRGLSPSFKTWVSKGGMLVAGPLYCVYNPETYANTQYPPSDAAEVFSATEQEILFPENLSIELIQPSMASIGSLPGYRLVEELKLDGAQAIGVLGNTVVLSNYAYCQGQSILAGSFLGNGYNRNTSPQLGMFIDVLAESLDAKPDVKATGGCFVRKAISNGKLIVFLTNPHKTALTTWVTFPKGFYGRLIDILNGREIGEVNGDKAVPVCINAEDSAVLLSQ